MADLKESNGAPTGDLLGSFDNAPSAVPKASSGPCLSNVLDPRKFTLANPYA